MLIEDLFGGLRSLFTRFSAKVEQQFLKPSKTELPSCSTILSIFKALTSQEEVLLGKPRDFKDFHKSLGLPCGTLKQNLSHYMKYAWIQIFSDCIFLYKTESMILSLYRNICRAYSSCFMHAIVACMRLPFFKLLSNFVHFCPNFQIFCPFHSFLPFFWKITLMSLLSRIGPDMDMRKSVFWHILQVVSYKYYK